MTTTQPKLVTADDLLRLDGRGIHGELIRGVFYETVPAGRERGALDVKLGAALVNFVEPRRLGTLVGFDSVIWLERYPDKIRAPYMAFTSVERLPLGEDVPAYADLVPDLVVEIASPSNSRREIHDKARMWLSHGVRLVWVVHPDTRTVDVHRADGDAARLGEDDSLDGMDVLPGFTCPVRTVFGE
jgi:Uma2 family endonuclease